MIDPAIAAQIVHFSILMWMMPLLLMWPALVLKRAFDAD